MVEEKKEWRNLEFLGYPNYEVSNLGDVRSLSYGLMSENRVSKHGYRRVRLYNNGKKKAFPVHRLIAFAFVENPNKKEWNVVNHKDENKLNNRADNLEWCNTAYNVTYGTCVQRRVDAKFKNGTWNCDELKEINRKPVYKYDFDGNIVKRFISQTESYKVDMVTSGMLRSDMPIKNGYFYSYREDIIVDDIWFAIERIKEIYESSRIKAYQYDYRGNLVVIHNDINKLNHGVRDIKLCLDGKKKYYNKYIWSSVELSDATLKEMIDDIMNYREIYCYDMESLVMRRYDNIDQVGSKFDKDYVISCCNENTLTHKGYIWRYFELDKDELNNIRDKHYGLRRLYMYDYEYNEKVYNSIKECVEDGFCKSKIHDCLNGEILNSNGFIFSYSKLRRSELDDIVHNIAVECKVKPVHQYDLEYNLIKIWKSPQDTKRAGFVPTYVSECCKGTRKAYRDYIWSYKKIK